MLIDVTTDNTVRIYAKFKNMLMVEDSMGNLYCTPTNNIKCQCDGCENCTCIKP